VLFDPSVLLFLALAALVVDACPTPRILLNCIP
jgi:hypothetical protein